MKALILNIPKLVFYNIIQKKIVFVPKLVEFGIKSSIACFFKNVLDKINSSKNLQKVRSLKKRTLGGI